MTSIAFPFSTVTTAFSLSMLKFKYPSYSAQNIRLQIAGLAPISTFSVGFYSGLTTVMSPFAQRIEF